MEATKTDKTFFEIVGKKLKNTSHVKKFPVYEDSENKFLNIFRGLKVSELDDTQFFIHELDYSDTWFNLSYRFYETPYLGWIIPMINNIQNPFDSPEAGTNIKILRYEYIYDILNKTKELGKL